MLKTFEQFIFSDNNSTFNIKSRSSWISINESQESKSQSAAIKLLMNKLGWDYQKSDKFVREDLRNDITSLRDKNIAKFTLGVTRMFVDGELKDASTISNLNSTLKLLSAHLNEYDRNLNGLSAEELISKFKKARENNVKKEKQEINRMKFGVSDYEIVRIDSFNDAKKYYKYTNPSSRWCLTHMGDMYDSYTCDGINQIYFCLKNGFEDIKPVVGENAPLDEYGLSMLSIIVNEEGELAYCTTRWNHDNGSNDSAMNAVEISKVVNANFYEVFKPNTKWKDMVDNVKRRLSNGEDPKKIFGIIGIFYDGCAIVKLTNKYNFINKNREFLSDKWYDNVYDFKDGYARVGLANKGYNFINTEGKLVSDKWYDSVYDFKDGYARVLLKDKGKGRNFINFINIEGKLLFDDFYDYDELYDFNGGYARVKIYGRGYNFINTEGKLLFDDWCNYNNVYDFNKKNGYAKVYSYNKGFNLINKEGKLISDKWFKDVFELKNGYIIVALQKGLYLKWYIINKEGKFVSDDGFETYHEAYSEATSNLK